MSQFTRLTWIFIVAGSLSLCVFVVWTAGFRINTTESIPRGIYRITDDPLAQGAYVIFCPPNNRTFHTARERGYISAGFCPHGYSYMMKRVLAAKGDVISVLDDGVRVNGTLLTLSVPLQTDGAARPMPTYRITQLHLTDEYLLMSDITALSFDARYFGPINRSQIIGVISPIMIW